MPPRHADAACAVRAHARRPGCPPVRCCGRMFSLRTAASLRVCPEDNARNSKSTPTATYIDHTPQSCTESSDGDSVPTGPTHTFRTLLGLHSQLTHQTLQLSLPAYPTARPARAPQQARLARRALVQLPRITNDTLLVPNLPQPPTMADPEPRATSSSTCASRCVEKVGELEEDVDEERQHADNHDLHHW